jgi:transposase
MSGTLHLAQAQSNRGPRGRKRDFPDAERLVKRLVAQELRLSFVPDPEQRLWRTGTRRKYQLTRDRALLQNQLESLLEEAHIKLQLGLGFAGCQFSAHVEGARRGRNQPGGSGCLGR